MDEKKFVKFKEEELGIKEYIKHNLGKGRISDVSIEYTPVGEKIIVSTNRPGLIIGTRGEKINELTSTLKKLFSLDNPHIEIRDVGNTNLDSQLVADSIALNLERKGSIKFKLIAYRTLSDIMSAGALGAEIVLSGKLPSERARSWRFSQGYLKKTGDTAKVVIKAMAQARTPLGVIGIKVGILPPNTKIHDQITINAELVSQLRKNEAFQPVEAPKRKPKNKKPRRKEK